MFAEVFTAPPTVVDFIDDEIEEQLRNLTI